MGRLDWIAQLTTVIIAAILWLTRSDATLWNGLPYILILPLSLWLGRRRALTWPGALALATVVAASQILPVRWQGALFLGAIHTVAFIVAAFFSHTRARQVEKLGSLQGIQAAFLISGFSALIYQVVWQRRLIESLGANNQSVATIIAIFMLGLGVGSLLADKLLVRAARYGLLMFCALEVGIGLIGVLSLPVLDLISYRLSLIPQGLPLIGFVTLIFLPPTILMGATLPVLVDLLKRHIPNFHENVGRLYAVNALGSAISALCVALLFFNMFGQAKAVMLAAACNTVTALMIWFGARHWKQTENAIAELPPAPVDNAGSAKLALKWPQVALLAGVTGLVSLSQEVLLLKQISWINAGRANTFGIGVGLFLLGLASGSWRQIHVPQSSLREYAARNWLYASACFTFFPFASTYIGDDFLNAAICYMALGICGFFGARTLPMVAGMLRAEDQTRFGRIMTANIVGSVLGSLIIGNWLLDYLNLSSVMLLIGAMGLALAITLYCLAWQASGRDQLFREERDWTALAAIVATVSLALWPLWSQGWLERMLYRRIDVAPFIFSMETKSGIVAVSQENDKQIVYGGGVYDGAVNTGVLHDKNGIVRPYRMLGMIDAPKQVLEIGLASGSWARILAQDPRVEHLTCVEINPAYLQLVKFFPEVAPVLQDPKTDIVIDDGRRWLKAHPERKFDLIVSNTTFHWRAGSSMITSVEFMRLAARSLKPGGLFFVNTTYSANVVTTARRVFPHVAMIENMVVASESPLDLDQIKARLRLQSHPGLQMPGALDKVINQSVVMTQRDPSLTTPIIDDEMNEEFANKPDRHAIPVRDLLR